MKTVRVISEFVDKYDSTRHYKPGEVVKFDDARATDMVERKLAVLVEEEKKAEPKAETEAKPEPKPSKPVIAKPLNKVSNGTKKGK